MFMAKIKGLAGLFRFELPFSAGVCVVMGQLFALGKFASLSQTILGFGAVFFVSASILVLNDYFDVETDKVNAPDRPIPAGLVTPSEALLLSIIILFIGLIFGYLISIIALLCSIVLFIVGFLYNWRFKRTGLLGNIMVSFSVGMTFIYGGVSVGLPFNKIVLFFSIIAALIDLGEEIAADAMDIHGDTLIHSNSIAIKYGRDTALRISIYIFFLVVFLTSIPIIMNWFSTIYLIPFVVMDSAIVYSSIRLLKAGDVEGRKYIRWIYLGSTLGLLIFILIRLIKR
ncbi:MAG: prenyltransferase [candidate division Zixibacteria bacterium HGW-Zixibacteria-1]|nr:MAG: prenyltransferase [candidate division Zixibacteria bacterium HGW-Zixibacteria-1]